MEPAAGAARLKKGLERLEKAWKSPKKLEERPEKQR